ncbi:hypothetical protein CR513_45464, partial [Mucuna pruriens]
MKESESISDFGNRVMMTMNQTKCYRQKMKDIRVEENILCSLTINFDFVICAIKKLRLRINDTYKERFNKRHEESLEQVLNAKEDVVMEENMDMDVAKEEEKERRYDKSNKRIYGLKQTSRQWYLKFNDTMNTVDRCIYMKVNDSRFVILVLYVDDIQLATNNVVMLHDVKKFLSNNFEMKDMGEASYVIRIKIIFYDKSQGLLGLSQKGYINKGDRFSQMQCPRNDLELKKMMCVQTCTRLDISFVVGMLGNCQSNFGIDHWKAAKKVFQYLQGTKDYILTYRRSYPLGVVIGYI